MRQKLCVLLFMEACSAHLSVIREYNDNRITINPKALTLTFTQQSSCQITPYKVQRKFSMIVPGLYVGLILHL